MDNVSLKMELEAKAELLKGAHAQNVVGHATTVEQTDRIATLEEVCATLRTNVRLYET